MSDDAREDEESRAMVGALLEADGLVDLRRIVALAEAMVK